MSFVFTLGSLEITIRNPAFGDSHSAARRQATGETEGGRLFVQDLGTEAFFYEGTWENLTRCERSDLEYFFGPLGTNKRQRRFLLGVTGNRNLGIGIGTEQGWGSEEGLGSGSIVVPDTASLGEVRLEQSELAFTATPRDRYTVGLRFRLYSASEC